MILQQGQSYLPLPDYWVALLHKRLMGQRVLRVSSSAQSLRAYAHCAAPSVCDGCLALALINIGAKTAHVQPPSLYCQQLEERRGREALENIRRR